MWLLAAPLAAISGLTPEAAAHCSTYVTVIAWSMPFCGVMTVGGLCLHGAGETTKPSLISIGINVINLFASWMLSGVVLKFNGHEVPAPLSIDPETWGVFGIAAGTSLSYIAGGVATVWVMAAGVKDLKLEARALKPHRTIAWRIARLGIPNFFEGLAMWGSSLFIMSFIGQIARGATGEQPHQGLIGAHMITVQWESFSFLPGFAMGTAAGALAGQYLGARNPQMARKAIWACTVLGIVLMGSMGILFMTEGRLLASMISSEPVHLEEVPKLLFACGTVQVFFALSMTVRQGLRGVGDVRWILAITVGSIYGLRLPLAWLLGVWMGRGLEGIWWGLCIELGIRGVLFLARFRYGNWQQLRV
jgi:putative MATE family efflux protein